MGLEQGGGGEKKSIMEEVALNQNLKRWVEFGAKWEWLKDIPWTIPNAQ